MLTRQVPRALRLESLESHLRANSHTISVNIVFWCYDEVLNKIHINTMIHTEYILALALLSSGVYKFWMTFYPNWMDEVISQKARSNVITVIKVYYYNEYIESFLSIKPIKERVDEL